MHPVRARPVEREVVVVACAGRERRLREERHAILLPRRREPMPMDERFFVETVLKPNPEPPTGFRNEAMGAIGLGKAEDSGRAPLHLDHSGVDLDRSSGGGSGGTAWDQQ